MTRTRLAALCLTALLVAPAGAPAEAAPPARMSGTTFAWQLVRRARAFGGSLFVERTPGARATLRFTGKKVVWHTWRGPGHGRARLLLDGERVRTVNNHAEEPIPKAKRIVRADEHGRHVLTIEVLGQPGAAGGGRAIAVDAFRVDGVYTRADAATYRWDLARASGAHGGAFRRSRVAGARASFTFTGKGIDWVGVSGPDGGMADLYVDGVHKRTVDTYEAEPRFGVLHSLVGLTDTEHTVTIEVLGRANQAARAAYVALDGWIVRRPSLRSFRGLGTWVDLYDYDLDPEVASETMAARGVRTLYLQTARYNSGRAFLYREEAGAWLEAAHANGMKVVGWYLPAYDEHLAADVRRTAAIADFRSPAGRRFDALAVDIEFKGETESLAEFNEGIRTHLRRVRARIGNAYPMGAIVPAPVAMARSPSSWTGFPWARIGRYADAVLPMAYWSYRTADGSCPADELYCALRYTEENITRSHAKTGLPVHVIGGVGHSVTADEIDDFVAGARTKSPLGGSLYDYKTTKAGWWDALAGLNDA